MAAGRPPDRRAGTVAATPAPSALPPRYRAASGPGERRRRCASGSSRVAVGQGFDEAGVRTAVTEPDGQETSTTWTASELAPLVEAAAKKLQETQQAQQPKAA